MKYIIGVDLGGTNLRLGLFDININLLDKKIFSTQEFKDRLSLIKGISCAIEELLEKNLIKKNNILGVGLGLPGPVDYRKQIVYFFPNIKGWSNIKLGKILKEKLKLNVFMDNDANLICLAEYLMGSAKGYRNVICVTLGTGVGGGLIIEGKLYRGTNSVAGEIGHIPLNQDGPLCGCGSRGCLESYVGNLRIIEKAKKIFKRNITLEEVSKLAKSGNKKAFRFWEDVGENIGIVLSGVVNMLNPEVIIIAGGISNAGKVLFDSIRKTIKRRAMPVQAKEVKVLSSCLKDNAGIIGAALLVKMEAGKC